MEDSPNRADTRRPPRRHGDPLRRRDSAAADRERRFIAEYLKDLHPVNAAIRVGFAPGHASVKMASDMVRRPNVRAAIEAEMKERVRRTEISTDRVLAQAARQAFFDPRRLLDPVTGKPLPLGDLPEDVALAIQSVKVTRDTLDGEVLTETLEVKFSDRNKAIDNLMRYLGLFEKDNAQRPAQLDGLFAYLDAQQRSRLSVQRAPALVEDARVLEQDTGGVPDSAAALVAPPGAPSPENFQSGNGSEKAFFDRLMR